MAASAEALSPLIAGTGEEERGHGGEKKARQQPESAAFYADEVNIVLDEERRTEQQLYMETVASWPEEDMSDLDELKFWEEEGTDLQGCLIIRIVAKYLPAQVVDKERLRRYVYRKMHEVIAAEEEFSVVYIHTGAEGTENSPGFLWLRSLHELLPFTCKQRLRAIYVLHPALRMRFLLWATSSWLSGGTYEKIVFVSRVEFLWDYMRESQLEIPSFVLEHDMELERRPLMDYGFEVDPLQYEQSSPYPSLGHRLVH